MLKNSQSHNHDVDTNPSMPLLVRLISLQCLQCFHLTGRRGEIRVNTGPNRMGQEHSLLRSVPPITTPEVQAIGAGSS